MVSPAQTPALRASPSLRVTTSSPEAYAMGVGVECLPLTPRVTTSNILRPVIRRGEVGSVDNWLTTG